MGSGIAGTAIAQAGVDVRMKDADLPRVAKGLAAAREILDDRLKRRRITPHEHARLVALLSGSDHYSGFGRAERSEEHTSELQSRLHLVCRLLLEKKKKKTK